jgi:phosphate/sulfate permease
VAVITGLYFDFTNGFHDSANAGATSIATGALKPKVAVGMSRGAESCRGVFSEPGQTQQSEE